MFIRIGSKALVKFPANFKRRKSPVVHPKRAMIFANCGVRDKSACTRFQVISCDKSDSRGISQRRRRGIVVESQPKPNPVLSGRHIPMMPLLDGAWNSRFGFTTTMPALTGFVVLLLALRGAFAAGRQTRPPSILDSSLDLILSPTMSRCGPDGPMPSLSRSIPPSRRHP